MRLKLLVTIAVLALLFIFLVPVVPTNGASIFTECRPGLSRSEPGLESVGLLLFGYGAAYAYYSGYMFLLGECVPQPPIG